MDQLFTLVEKCELRCMMFSLKLQHHLNVRILTLSAEMAKCILALLWLSAKVNNSKISFSYLFYTWVARVSF